VPQYNNNIIKNNKELKNISFKKGWMGRIGFIALPGE
jgi:hypothetical protein